MRNVSIVCFMIGILILGGCSSYEYKPVPFKAVESYPNHIDVFDAVIASRAWTNQAEAKSAFGFDIRGAGLTPVQVVVDNRGANTLKIVEDQTLLRDAENNFWNLLPAQVAYDRVDKEAAPGRTLSKAGSKGLLAGAAGAVIGAAIGVVSGGGVGDAALKGAAAGTAAGAVLGGAQGLDDPKSKAAIAQDLRSKSLGDKSFSAHEISHGFLFFPGEIKNATMLRLKLQNQTTGEIRIVELSLAD